MCGPPEPLIEVFLDQCTIDIVPEPAKCLFEQVSPVDFEVELFQITQPNLLLVGKVPRVLQPDVAGFLQQARILRFEFPSLFFANRVHSIHEVPYNMEFVKDKQSIWKTRLDDIHVRSPHVTTDSLYLLTAFFAQIITEGFQSLSGSIFPGPQQAFFNEVVHLSVIDMPFSSGNFVNTDVLDIAHIPVPQPVVNNVFDRFSNGIPAKPKQSTNHLPGHFPSPSGQEHTKRNRKRTFPLGPRDRLYLDSAGSALNPSRLVDQQDGNPLQWHALPSPFIERVVATPFCTAPRTKQTIALIRDQIHQQLPIFLFDLFYTMSLESQGLSDYAIDEHESYAPSHRFCHQQEVLDLIHTFNFLNPLAPTNSCEEPQN